MKQISLFDFDEPAEVKAATNPASSTGKEQKKSPPENKLTDQVELKPEPAPKQEILPEPIVEEVREIPAEIYVSTNEVLPVVKSKTSTRGRKSVKDMEPLHIVATVPPDEELFSRRYYSIGTVAEMFSENISLIRFWENEFDILKPKKNGKGDRLFRPEDIKNLQVIYSLLREQKYTIEGAKEYLKRNKRQDEVFRIMDELKKIKSFLLEMKAGL